MDVVAERGPTALADLPRPGQSTRLTDEQWIQLTATLAAKWAEVGYDEPTWIPALVRAHIADSFGIEYSLAHMYCVTKRAGYPARQAAHATTNPTQPHNGGGVGSSKKWPTLKAAGYRIVVIDQDTQVVKTEQKRAWLPVNSRPRLPVSGDRKSINLLGAITDDGARFISFVNGWFTGPVPAHFLRELQQEFGTKLVIVLDNAPYFIAKYRKKEAAKHGLLLEYLPPYAPEMNSLEQCWRQLNNGRDMALSITLRTESVPDEQAPRSLLTENL